MFFLAHSILYVKMISDLKSLAVWSKICRVRLYFMSFGVLGDYSDEFLHVHLNVPKCEILDPFFYTNKSYMGR
jgi:hypothetical protein